LGVAAQNGASIRLVTGDLDAGEARNRKAIRELTSGEIGGLITHGLRVLIASESLPVLLHSKLVVVDRCRGYIGSANLSWHAMESNFEIGVSLSASQAETLDGLVDYLEARSMLTEVKLARL
jgi:phosphatidylserine/phosphatidylglycerophosphate/cardiolipin synthase-like enzyme